MTPIQEYRKWLTQYLEKEHDKSDGNHLDTGYINGLEYALDNFNRLFSEDTQTLSDHKPTMSDLIMDTIDIPVDDGPKQMNMPEDRGVPDETGSLYPRTQPHSFPPRD